MEPGAVARLPRRFVTWDRTRDCFGSARVTTGPRRTFGAGAIDGLGPKSVGAGELGHGIGAAGNSAGEARDRRASSGSWGVARRDWWRPGGFGSAWSSVAPGAQPRSAIGTRRRDRRRAAPADRGRNGRANQCATRCRHRRGHLDYRRLAWWIAGSAGGVLRTQGRLGSTGGSASLAGTHQGQRPRGTRGG
jgi:hypothetical protein